MLPENIQNKVWDEHAEKEGFFVNLFMALASVEVAANAFHWAMNRMADETDCLFPPYDDPDKITTCCWDGLHEVCSGRVTTNPGADWRELHYTACQCRCH